MGHCDLQVALTSVANGFWALGSKTMSFLVLESLQFRKSNGEQSLKQQQQQQQKETRSVYNCMYILTQTTYSLNYFLQQ